MMMAQGFKPVGWVAAVAAAALSCYMLSLRVASERAELLTVERQIIAAKQNIRTLQTELGTRGRLTQLEQWNADVLALAAPASAQFLESEVTLARFDTQEKSFEEKAKVVMAAQEEAQPAPRVELPVIQARAEPARPKPQPQLVHQASYARAAAKPAPSLKQASYAAAEIKPIVKTAAFKAVEAKAAPLAKKLAEPKAPAVKLASKAVAETKPAPAKKEASKASAEAKPAKEIKLASKAPAKAKKAPAAKPASLIGDDLAKEIGEAARSEKKSGGSPAAR